MTSSDDVVVPAAGMKTAPRRMLALLHIAAHPGASNREIAMAAGIRADSQVSRILRRMLDLGLAVNRSDRPGSGAPNAWHLTAAGQFAADAARRDRIALAAAARGRPEQT
ncbi:MAG TPA: helix-turn-helix domain-containing protein [Solirubrobacteraceae bacterium]|nr:helix-turn-helix domain-containing protein [Solirubrobacteraceae bacterium]